MIHVEPAISMSQVWAVIDGFHVLATKLNRKDAVAECRKLRGCNCLACENPCPPGTIEIICNEGNYGANPRATADSGC